MTELLAKAKTWILDNKGKLILVAVCSAGAAVLLKLCQ